MLSDAEVMLRVAAGDDSAFDYLVEKYRRPMISFMYRMTHNQAVAEELAQEVFLRVYRSRQSYAASAKFTTWLYRIATNLAVNHARDTKHERPENTVNIDEPDTETGMTVDVADSGLNAEQTILRRERLAAIRQAGGSVARTAAHGRAHAQVSEHGLQADCGGAEVERVGNQVVAVSRV